MSPPPYDIDVGMALAGRNDMAQRRCGSAALRGSAAQRLRGSEAQRLSGSAAEWPFSWLPEVELENITKGGPVSWASSFRLRHLNTGDYLTIPDESAEKGEVRYASPCSAPCGRVFYLWSELGCLAGQHVKW